MTSSRRRAIEVNGFRLYPEIIPVVFGATGGELWEASVHLAAKLDDLLPQEKEGVVLEVGAGLGLPGLTAARAGRRVVLTDSDPNVVDNLRRQIRDNGLVAEARVLDLDDPLSVTAAVVLASDVVYAPKLGRSLAAFLRRTKPALALVLQRKGRPGFHDAFLPAIMEAPVDLWVEHLDYPPGRDDFVLCRITPKRPTDDDALAAHLRRTSLL